MAEQNEISVEIEEERGPIPAHPGAVECRIPHPVDLFDECDNIFMHKDRYRGLVISPSEMKKVGKYLLNEMRAT
jgi:hypothetical protein